MGALINILEATPPADILDQDMIEVRFSGADILDQPHQAGPILEFQSAFAAVSVGFDNREILRVRHRPRSRRPGFRSSTFASPSTCGHTVPHEIL